MRSINVPCCSSSCSPPPPPSPPPVAGEKTVFVINRLCCPVEADLIKKGLAPIQGIIYLDFDLMAKKLVVTHHGVARETLVAALTAVGMAPEAEARMQRLPPPPTLSKKEWAILGLAGLAAFTAELLSFSGMPEDSPLLVGLSLASILLCGIETLKKGWTALVHLSLNIHFLMSMAVVGAVLIGQWPEAAMVIFLFAVAEWVEALSMEKARGAVRNLLSLAPETASMLQPQGTWVEVEAAAVPVDAMVRAKPGERIALDGVVVNGCSTVNQAPITGESVPVTKEAGDRVHAGSINGPGMLEYRVTADWRHTTLARIIDTIEEAHAKRAPMQRFVDRFAAWYTPVVVGLAVAISLVPPGLGMGSFSEWFYKALVMLVVACPCALVISTPVTVVSGLAAGARRGILIKGGLFLEQGGNLRALALDKTGTLTRGQFALTDLIPLQGKSREEVLSLAASLEAHSEHAVAAALVAEWGERPLLPVTGFHALPGLGARGEVAGVWYHIGNPRLLKERGRSSPELEAILAPLEQERKSVVVLFADTKPLAVFAVSDQLRPEAPAMVAALRQLGLSLAMLTGDNEVTARAIAHQVGIDEVHAALLPGEKLAKIEEMTERFGVVGMVGDGINDAPALARASIGFAMGVAGTDSALETADVAIMDDDLGKLPEFILLSRRTRAILWQNIALALGIKGVFLILAALGFATLWMAVIADMGTSLLVIFNGRRLLGGSGASPGIPRGVCGKDPPPAWEKRGPEGG